MNGPWGAVAASAAMHRSGMPPAPWRLRTTSAEYRTTRLRWTSTAGAHAPASAAHLGSAGMASPAGCHTSRSLERMTGTRPGVLWVE